MKSKYEYIIKIKNPALLPQLKQLKCVKKIELIKKNQYRITTRGKYLKNRSGMKIQKILDPETPDKKNHNWLKIIQIGLSIGGILIPVFGV